MSNKGAPAVTGEISERFHAFTESENQRLLRASYISGCLMFALALLSEHYLFEGRFTAVGTGSAIAFVLFQCAVLGLRMILKHPAPSDQQRGWLVAANGLMWVALSTWHTTAGDSAPYGVEFVIVQLAFCFLFSGLSQRMAVTAGLIISISLPLAIALLTDASSIAAARAAFVMLAFNGVGIAGRHWLDLSQRAQFVSRLTLKTLATTDPLTGLANRRGIEQGLEAAVHVAWREGHHLQVVLLDLDKFKPINDRFGHDAGDAALCEVARRLKAVARRSTDVVARLGGDEFVVICTAPQVEDLRRLHDDLHAATREMLLRFDDGDAGLVRLSASLGVLMVRRPGPWLAREQLFQNADALALMAKRAGGAQMVVREWTEDQQRRQRRSHALRTSDTPSIPAAGRVGHHDLLA